MSMLKSLLSQAVVPSERWGLLTRLVNGFASPNACEGHSRIDLRRSHGTRVIEGNGSMSSWFRVALRFVLCSAIAVALRATSQGIGSSRVAVIGAGPGGLTLASLLHKTGKFEVHVYERSKDPLKASVGGGLQLTSGATLLREQLGVDLSSCALKLDRVISRDAKGRILLELDVANALRDAGLSPGYAIMRDALQQVLYDVLSNEVPVLAGRELTAARQTEAAVLLTFNNDVDEVPYDLVFGCDGVGSTVEATCFGDMPKKFTGVRILLCVSDELVSSLSSRTTVFEQFLGNGAYCLKASYGARTPSASSQMLALCYHSSEPGAEARWADDDAGLRSLAEATIAHAGLTEAIRGPLDSATRFYEASVYSRPPRLTGWSNGRVVLCGDAAHAMPPFLGQGANQAIADAVSLAQRLDQAFPDYSAAFQAYHAARFLTTTRLQLNSRILGALETQRSALGCAFRDGFFSVTGKLGVAKQVFLDGATPRI